MSMRVPHVDDRVVLLEHVPETALHRGQVGVVCSQWSRGSQPFFEVEFVFDETHDVSRQMLTLEQIALDEAAETTH